MRKSGWLLILLCLTGCAAPYASPGEAGVWPDRQVMRDVAAIRAGMEQVRGASSDIAARRGG